MIYSFVILYYKLIFYNVISYNTSSMITVVILFQYIYKNAQFEKPFFSTYVKTSMFTIYLLGLCFWPPWRDQCSKPANYMVIYLWFKVLNKFYLI